jgi:hypothetical protein
MTRMLGPGSSVFAAPHGGLAVWDNPINAVKAGTIGDSHFHAKYELNF